MHKQITWDMFKEEGKHQWVFNDRELQARYAARKIDGVFEFSIRDELTSDPSAEDREVVAFIEAVNVYRQSKGLADRRTKRQQ